MVENDYIETLQSRYKSIRDELDVLHKQYSSIADQIAAKEEVAKHLSRLLAAEGHGVSNAWAVGQGGSRPVDLAFDCLDQRSDHTPIHYKELASMLISNNVAIAGRDPAATLLAQIHRDDRFLRVGPGEYALVKWGIQSSVGPKPRRRRRRR